MKIAPLIVVLVALLCAVGLYCAFNAYTKRAVQKDISAKRKYLIGILIAFLGVPALLLAIGQYTLFAETKPVDACGSCHVMAPFVEDARNPKSLSLAARHIQNGWLGDNGQQCYSCHAGAGLAGAMEAKLDGFRHLMKYTTDTYTLPITFNKTPTNANCLSCHADTRKFKAVQAHEDVLESLRTADISCLNCHGPAHPPRSTRSTEEQIKQ